MIAPEPSSALANRRDGISLGVLPALTFQPPVERLITDAYRTIKSRSWTPVASRYTVDGMDRMLDRFIDRCLRWQHQREVRRSGQWKRHMYRDQRGIWCRDPRFGIW